MNTEFANNTVTEFMKPVHKFITGRINNFQDAEDLVQEICIKIFKNLCIRDDIIAVDKYVWTIVHNCLANYYKKNGRMKQYIGFGIDEVSYGITPEDDYIHSETITRLHSEISYLSKTQREVVILYYYHGLKQRDIAERLNIAVGTVKWYLSEAKIELKKGMEIMKTDELKFNPIKFNGIGINGSASDKIYDYLSNSMIAQNIAYCVYREKLPVKEIAAKLGISPVYVENELELMEKYGLIINDSCKYLTNFLIEEATKELSDCMDELYTKAAKLLANDLYDSLIDNEILNDENLYYPDGDKNFLMWTLIPYILAFSGRDFVEKIKFEEAATARIDGGTNIITGYIMDKPNVNPNPINWFGPMWNGNNEYILWQIKHSNLHTVIGYQERAQRELKLMTSYFNNEILSKDDYAYLVSEGYLTGKDGDFKPSIVIIKDKNYNDKLLAVGSEIKNKYMTELNRYKNKYIEMILSETPKHLRKMCEFGLQYIFYSDGLFMGYSMLELINNGKIEKISDNRLKSLTSLIIPA